jgi:outer membrane biosynthesis protein TonB
MADILNSALTGDADFAGTIFGGKNQEPVEPTPSETPAPETQQEEPKPAAETPKEETPKAEKKAPVKAESKAKATKEEVEKKVADITKEASSEKTTEKSNENTSDDDLPLNPHFSDKPVSNKPEGDDSEKGISSWKEIKGEMKKAREERDRLKAELEATKEKVGQ